MDSSSPILATLTALKNRVSRFVFARRHAEESKDRLMGVVGTVATLVFPQRPHWVRVEQTATGNTTEAQLILPEGTTLVPKVLPKSELEAKRYLHRLVAAEAAHREADNISRRAPTRDQEWKRAANQFLSQFREIHSPSAMAREILFEDLVREVQLRFCFLVRRLRLAQVRLMDTGHLTNRDLEELWAWYRHYDEDAMDPEEMERQGVFPAHLRPETDVTV